MKKIILSFLTFVLITGIAEAQKADIIVKNSEKGLYVEHKVVAKESFYSVGRLFNVSPKSIASFNKLDMNKGLFIDQKIRIPLTDTNFTQKGNTGTPVYYKAEDKESFEKISANNRNVSIASLRLWNNISGDKTKEDTKLIVGFLLSKEMPAVTISTKPQQQEETIEKKEEKTVINTLVAQEKEPETKDDVKTIQPAVVKEEVRPVPEGQGYFKEFFEQQVKVIPAAKNETVTSGIFKTMSGWQDSKYYLLKDGMQPGTIIKIINPDNNKSVYAKVLGEMSGIRQNEGLDIRISNAAAAALQIADTDKFIVKINY